MGPDNVLVLYNSDSTDGTDIANYYAQAHPGVHLLGLSGVTASEDITADYYLNVIRPQILNSGMLTSSIDTIVTAKGLPLRITVTEPNPGTYVDPSGVVRTVSSTRWKTYSSLESELTRITTISTWQQMGDQYFSDPRLNNPSLNPYYPNFPLPNYKPVQPFDTALYGGMRLTARLDGFTTSDVEAAIDRAQHVFVAPGSAWTVVDDDPNVQGSDRMLPLVNNVLAPRSQNYVYDNTAAAITTAPGPVIGYVSHGVHSDSLSPGYINNQLDFTLAKGAVFFTHESFNAYSFQPGGNLDDQGLVAEWLAKGGTAGIGNVQEPWSGTYYEANEDLVFSMLLDGYTWAEAAWSSITQLSYVNTVVGDPLMVWHPAISGDATLDGVVDVNDLTVVLRNYRSSSASWNQGDFNGDGTVDINDLTVVLGNYGHSTLSAGALETVPEPSAIILFGLGVLGLLACARRR
jgi:uncharacterized protein (TIGR03790 family)